MKIPKEFKLMGQTINVEYKNKLIQETDCIGQASYRENKIFLQKQVEGITRKKEMIEQTFLHELLHFILDRMGENELRDNEKFINMFSGLLHQYIESNKGELK